MKLLFLAEIKKNHQIHFLVRVTFWQFQKYFYILYFPHIYRKQVCITFSVETNGEVSMSKIVLTISSHGLEVGCRTCKVAIRGSNPRWACPQIYFLNFGSVELKIL